MTSNGNTSENHTTVKNHTTNPILPQEKFSRLYGLKGAAIKAKLARGESIVCMTLWFPCALVGEMLSAEKLDVLIVDMEHGPWDTANITQLLAATVASPVAIFVRPTTLIPEQIQLLFDMGIDGLMVGHCDSLQIARRAVALMKYAPMGRRGVGPSRAGAYLRDIFGYLQQANDATQLWIQVEQRVPKSELGRMLRLPGVDALMVGPCDMAASLGHLLDWEHSSVTELIEQTVDVARKLGRPFGVPGSPWEGQQINMITNDIAALRKGFTDALDEWQKHAPAGNATRNRPRPDKNANGRAKRSDIRRAMEQR
jgi:4-hydroxy-2-oxoheptanedioate aldolase